MKKSLPKDSVSQCQDVYSNSTLEQFLSYLPSTTVVIGASGVGKTGTLTHWVDALFTRERADDA